MELDQDTRQRMLERAVTAARSRLAIGPSTDPEEASRINARARTAVTEALTAGGHLHTQIAQLAGCSGLLVVGMIDNWSAQAQALQVERHAAARYVEQVRDAARQHALQRLGSQGYGSVSQIAREIGVERAVVYTWIEKARAEEALSGS